LRRLRSVVAAFGKALPAADRDFLSDELSRLNDALAPARTLDVLLGELVPPARRALRDGSDLDPLVTRMTEERRTAYDRLAEHLRSPRHSGAVLRLLQWFEARGAAMPGERTVGEVLSSLLDRRFRAVKKRGKHFRRQTPKARHRLRIAVKKLRYAIELLGSPLARDDARDFLKALRRLQDGLGHANDVHAARELLGAAAAEGEPDSRLTRAGSLLLAWHERDLAAREREVRAELRRLKHSPRFWREPAHAP
jgi:CHAD domain-containing protein